jgi:hypothetical protein
MTQIWSEPSKLLSRTSKVQENGITWLTCFMLAVSGQLMYGHCNYSKKNFFYTAYMEFNILNPIA